MHMPDEYEALAKRIQEGTYTRGCRIAARLLFSIYREKPHLLGDQGQNAVLEVVENLLTINETQKASVENPQEDSFILAQMGINNAKLVLAEWEEEEALEFRVGPLN